MAESVGLAMPQAATLMMEAADTILSLRDRAQDLQAENAKLREERREYQATIDSLVDECADHKDENEKLRKLVSDMWHELNYMSVRAENGTNHCLDHMAAFDARMEDLGIEVDE